MIWFIIESAGLVCTIMTYSIVLTVMVGFIRVGIWEGLLDGDYYSYLHLAVFQYHCALIFWSHFKESWSVSTVNSTPSRYCL